MVLLLRRFQKFSLSVHRVGFNACAGLLTIFADGILVLSAGT